jgi:cytochrome c553
MLRKTWLYALLLGAVALSPSALRAAGDHDDDEDERHEGRRARGRDLPARPLASEAAMRASPGWELYASECGSCHLAFPPGLLPARSWSALLSGLDDHFGENAEVDEATRTKLARFLERWAADAGRPARAPVGTAPLRITELASWRHEHDELPAAVFRRKAVGSAANCTACHREAEQGVFDEDAVRIPRDPPPGAKLPAHADPAR